MKIFITLILIFILFFTSCNNSSENIEYETRERVTCSGKNIVKLEEHKEDLEWNIDKTTSIKECSLGCYLKPEGDKRIPTCKDYCDNGETQISKFCKDNKIYREVKTCQDKEFKSTNIEEYKDCDYQKSAKLNDDKIKTTTYGCTDNSTSCQIIETQTEECQKGMYFDNETFEYKCNTTCIEGETQTKKGCTDQNTYIDLDQICENDTWKITRSNSEDCNFTEKICFEASNRLVKERGYCSNEREGCKIEEIRSFCELGCADEYSCNETCNPEHTNEYDSCEGNNATHIIEHCDENGIIIKEKQIIEECDNNIQRTCHDNKQTTIYNKCQINQNLEASCKDVPIEIDCTCVPGFEDTKGYCKESCDNRDSSFTEYKCFRGDVRTVKRRCIDGDWMIGNIGTTSCQSFRNYTCQENNQIHEWQTCVDGQCQTDTYTQTCDPSYGCANNSSCDSACGILINNLEKCVNEGNGNVHIDRIREECINGNKITTLTERRQCQLEKIECVSNETYKIKKLIGCMTGKYCRYKTVSVERGACPMEEK